jgi:signal transduction histidine kinase
LTSGRDANFARLRALAEEQAALRRVATLVAADPHPEEVFECVCEEVGVVLDVSSTNLARFGDGDTAHVVGAWSADGAPVIPADTSVPLDGPTAVVQVSSTGRPARVDDYAAMPGRLPARLRRAGIRSSVAAPVTVSNRLWGAIVASSGEPNDFEPEAEGKIAAFAELLSDSLASVQAREELARSRARIVEAADTERRRLERNLHDGAQQRLVALALDLRRAESELPSCPDEARRLLHAAREELDRALEELRELARGIHPAILTDHGLAPALKGLAARAAVCVELGELPDRRLPEQVEAAVYYLVAEALTNVARHARASGARVDVVCDAETASVTVADDGVGGAGGGRGSGLRGLADRVEALNGRLDVVSPPGGGTRLSARIPLRQAASGSR